MLIDFSRQASVAPASLPEAAQPLENELQHAISLDFEGVARLSGRDAGATETLGALSEDN